MRKRLSLLLVLFLGGIVIMTGCRENKNSRQWIENNFTKQLSRVYQTKNIEDLFQEFPEGFKIYQVSIEKNSIIDVTLYGDSQSNSISGTIVKTDRTTDTIISKVDINYINNQFTFSDSTVSNELWKFKSFLFQHFTINKQLLESLQLKSKSFNQANGSFDINYRIKNTILNTFFLKKKDEEAVLTLGSSFRKDDYYYYSVVVDYGDGCYFRETISNDNGE